MTLDVDRLHVCEGKAIHRDIDPDIGSSRRDCPVQATNNRITSKVKIVLNLSCLTITFLLIQKTRNGTYDCITTNVVMQAVDQEVVMCASNLNIQMLLPLTALEAGARNLAKQLCFRLMTYAADRNAEKGAVSRTVRAPSTVVIWDGLVPRSEERNPIDERKEPNVIALCYSIVLSPL